VVTTGGTTKGKKVEGKSILTEGRLAETLLMFSYNSNKPLLLQPAETWTWTTIHVSRPMVAKTKTNPKEKKVKDHKENLKHKLRGGNNMNTF
jgi:hypothetical protein